MVRRAPRGGQKRSAGSARSSAGDPARTLELLWRGSGDVQASRGPKQRTTVDAVIAAAIGVADSAGLGALTMRSVAAESGITPMATYTYVAGKAELLDLMLDTVYQQMPRPDLTGMSWRERVSTIADQNRAMLELHPWVVCVATTRPPLGPGMVAKYEYELHAFDLTGLSDLEMDSALTYVLGFVSSVARIAVDTQHASVESGLSDHVWWERTAPLLAGVLDPERFPLATRVGAAAGQAHDSAYSAAHAYEFGLTRVLDGLAALIDRT